MRSGILFSFLIVDRLGRRGFLTVGFIVAAFLWLTLGSIKPIAGVAEDETNDSLVTALVIVGSFASATRGFAPEAANLWALETFPTEQRATCYSAANIMFQLSASIVLPVGGAIVNALNYSPVPLLVGYAVMQLIFGIFTWFLPNETVNKAMQDTLVVPLDTLPGGHLEVETAPAPALDTPPDLDTPRADDPYPHRTLRI